MDPGAIAPRPPPPPPPGFVPFDSAQTPDDAGPRPPPPPPPGFVPFGAAPEQAQQAREVAATRRGGLRAGRDYPQVGREAPSSTWEDVGNVGRQVLSGANEGVAQGIVRPINAAATLVNAPISMALSKITGQEQPQSNLESVYRKQFVDETPSESYPQDLGHAAGKFAGENLPMVAGLGGLASAGRYAVEKGVVPGVRGLVNSAKGGYNSAMDALAQKPVTAAVGGTGAALESGAVGEHVRQHSEEQGYAPETQHVNEQLGQMFGPGALKMMPGALLAKGAQIAAKPVASAARSAAGSLTNAFPDAVERLPESISGRLKKLATAAATESKAVSNETANNTMAVALEKPESQAGVAEAQNLEKEIPGFRPGFAKATNDPVLLNTQKELERKATGPELRQSQEAYDANTKSLRDRMESLAPPVEAPKSERIGPELPTQNPQDVVQNAAAQRVKNVANSVGQKRTDTEGNIGRREAELQGRIAGEQQVAQHQLREASDALPDAERADRGARAREIHEAAELASSNQTTELRNAIAHPETPIQVGGQEMTVNAALDRRAAINQRMRQYGSATARSVADVEAMDALQTERGHIDRALEGVNLPGMAEYRNYYRDKHVPKFQEGAGRDIGRYDRFGYDKNKVPDEKVNDTTMGTVSAARQFTATHGDNPEMVQNAVDHWLGRLKVEGTDPVTGLLREGAVSRFLNRYREQLDVLPPQVRAAVTPRNADQIHTRIGELGEQAQLAANPKTARTLDPALEEMHQRLGQLEQRQRAVADTRVASELSKKGTPEKTITNALNDWQLMKELRRSVGKDPQAQAALTRAVMDKAPDVIDTEKFRAFLKMRSLKEVLTPEHLASLENIAKAAEMHGRLPRPAGAVELPKSAIKQAEEASGISVKSAIGSILGLARGRSSKAVEIGGQAVKSIATQHQRAVDEAYREILSNPDLTRTFSQSFANGKPTQMQLSKMHAYLLTAGLLPTDTKDEQK